MLNNIMDTNFDPRELNFKTIEEEKVFCSELGKRFSLFENNNEDAPKWLLKKELKGEVVFYPGTFNPWHLGHRACLDLCPVKNIVVVPDFNPWKEGDQRQRPWEHLKDLVYRLGKSDYSIYPGFLAKDVGNPTVSWFPKIQLDKKSLLMGDDSFLNLHKWKDIDELVKHICKLYVAPRGSDPLGIEEQVKRFPQLNIIFLDHHDYEEISSTELRNK